METKHLPPTNGTYGGHTDFQWPNRFHNLHAGGKFDIVGTAPDA